MTPTPQARIAVSKAGSNLEAVNTAINWGKQIRGWYRQRTEWTVSVNSEDKLYDRVHRWMTDQESGVGPARALTAKLGSVYELEEITFVGTTPDGPIRATKPAPKVALYHDDGHEKHIVVNGHEVTVGVSRDDTVAEGENKKRRGPDVIRFRARSEDGRRAVIGLLEELARDRTVRQPALYLLNAWGGWNRRDDLPPRALSSVILREGQLERIHEDLRDFLGEEAEYNRRGLPWHRGYLFHGPPGTGKTSVVRALAAELKLDLWYAPLGDLRDDTNLLSIVNEVRPRSILLLEDFDVYHASKSREEIGQTPTMAGLLNALDGVATPHGLITILTTNDVSVVDPALLRPGRVDYVEEIGLADARQVARAWGWYYDCEPYSVHPSYRSTVQTIAEAIEVFKRNADPADARAEVLRLKTALPVSQGLGRMVWDKEAPS